MAISRCGPDRLELTRSTSCGIHAIRFAVRESALATGCKFGGKNRQSLSPGWADWVSSSSLVVVACCYTLCCFTPQSHEVHLAVFAGCQFVLTYGEMSVHTDIVPNRDSNDDRGATPSVDPAIGLRAVLALRRLAERVEAEHVAKAREKGWSWQQIADGLGMTRQSVHAKYGGR
jgi:hypothetical protein